MTIGSKRDEQIIVATIRRIVVAATLTSAGKTVIPLGGFQSAMVRMAQDPEMHALILHDVANDAKAGT